jgi:hypothetical protein
MVQSVLLFVHDLNCCEQIPEVWEPVEQDLFLSQCLHWFLKIIFYDDGWYCYWKFYVYPKYTDRFLWHRGQEHNEAIATSLGRHKRVPITTRISRWLFLTKSRNQDQSQNFFEHQCKEETNVLKFSSSRTANVKMCSFRKFEQNMTNIEHDCVNCFIFT